MKEANLSERQYTYMRDKNPKRLELIKKGILYEQIKSGDIEKEKLWFTQTILKITIKDKPMQQIITFISTAIFISFVVWYVLSELKLI